MLGNQLEYSEYFFEFAFVDIELVVFGHEESEIDFKRFDAFFIQLVEALDNSSFGFGDVEQV